MHIGHQRARACPVRSSSASALINQMGAPVATDRAVAQAPMAPPLASQSRVQTQARFTCDSLRAKRLVAFDKRRNLSHPSAPQAPLTAGDGANAPYFRAHLHGIASTRGRAASTPAFFRGPKGAKILFPHAPEPCRPPLIDAGSRCQLVNRPVLLEDSFNPASASRLVALDARRIKTQRPAACSSPPRETIWVAETALRVGHRAHGPGFPSRIPS